MSLPHDFPRTLANKTDQGLYDMFEHADEYEQEALDAAQEEMKKRGLSVEYAAGRKACALQRATERLEQVSHVRPWIRYWARMIDIWLFGLVCVLVIGAVAPSVPGVSTFVLSLLFLLVWCFVEAFLLSTWGSTPGKALLRVMIRDKRGKKLDYKTALYRSFDVWYRGLGFGIPLVSFVTAYLAYERLNTKGITSWDESLRVDVSHKDVGAVRGIVAVLLFLSIALLLFLDRTSSQTPEPTSTSPSPIDDAQ